MQLTHFDTHIAVKKLIATGLEQLQAEEIISVIKTSQISEYSNTVTKDQISLLEKDIINGTSHQIGDLSNQIQVVKSELKKDINDVRVELNNVRNELKKDISDVRAELKKDISDVRAELNNVKTELKQDINNLRVEFIDRIEKSKWDAIKWMVAISFAQTSIILALIKYIMN